VGKPDRKRPFRGRRHKWEDNNKMDLQEVGWRSWTGLIWLGKGHVIGSCERDNDLPGSIKFKEFLD
jgi:hypothetical protein